MARPGDPNAKIKLLTAAEAEFVERGLDRAKVEGITARAGLSKGAFYLHFASKEDAFRQLVETTLARLAHFIDAIPRDEAALDFDNLGAAQQLWLEKDLEIFEFIWQNRGLMGLLLEGGSSADYRYLMGEFAERSCRAIARSLELGTRHGLYRKDLDIELASLFIAGAYDRLARQIVHFPKKPDLLAMLRKIQMMVIRGVGSEVLVAHATAATTPAPISTPAPLSALRSPDSRVSVAPSAVDSEAPAATSAVKSETRSLGKRRGPGHARATGGR